jgi:hypothetical protein
MGYLGLIISKSWIVVKPLHCCLTARKAVADTLVADVINHPQVKADWLMYPKLANTANLGDVKEMVFTIHTGDF